ncbi:hypothetical protein DSO57_1031337 [Entomophthora muscae]|uniref:Uncharacterized protein n=1 Tax=Entomophthora muscae TaxID=34485 RepID=A0ACC2UL31_9FUNG|nr:hypothetical protein DSO57_1031337 [Entomophthora muscae]
MNLLSVFGLWLGVAAAQSLMDSFQTLVQMESIVPFMTKDQGRPLKELFPEIRFSPSELNYIVNKAKNPSTLHRLLNNDEVAFNTSSLSLGAKESKLEIRRLVRLLYNKGVDYVNQNIFDLWNINDDEAKMLVYEDILSNLDIDKDDFVDLMKERIADILSRHKYFPEYINIAVGFLIPTFIPDIMDTLGDLFTLANSNYTEVSTLVKHLAIDIQQRYKLLPNNVNSILLATFNGTRYSPLYEIRSPLHPSDSSAKKYRLSKAPKAA